MKQDVFFIFNMTIETISYIYILYKFYILERDGFSLPAISIDCEICKVLGCDAVASPKIKRCKPTRWAPTTYKWSL